MKKIDFRTASFLTSAANLSQCPPARGAEIAFAGRSNAGKSSAINTLTNNKKLARTSKNPGCTQLINFFQLNNSADLRIVDLPGYGYAKVSHQIKENWQKHLSQYLHERESLKGLVLVMDIRHPLQDTDRMMIDWSLESDMPLHLLLTKCDKLSRGAAKNTLSRIINEIEKNRAQFSSEVRISGQIFSSHNGEGVDELAKHLRSWLAPEN